MSAKNASGRVSGRCWLFGDDLNTDYLAPGRLMKFGIEKIAEHCLEDLDPEFARKVLPGDVIVAGSNFGAGSSREQAAEVLRHLQVSCVVARSFSGLFYRNAFNLGLPLLVIRNAAAMGGSCLALVEAWRSGDAVEVDFENSQLVHVATQGVLPCDPIPAHLRALVDDGGLVAHLRKRIEREPSRFRKGERS